VFLLGLLLLPGGHFRNCGGHVSPEIARDSEATLKAMKELEQGWQKGIYKISERASLAKGPDTWR
jgi:hypothetical protein